MNVLKWEPRVKAQIRSLRLSFRYTPCRFPSYLLPIEFKFFAIYTEGKYVWEVNPNKGQLKETIRIVMLEKCEFVSSRRVFAQGRHYKIIFILVAITMRLQISSL